MIRCCTGLTALRISAAGLVPVVEGLRAAPPSAKLVFAKHIRKIRSLVVSFMYVYPWMITCNIVDSKFVLLLIDIVILCAIRQTMDDHICALAARLVSLDNVCYIALRIQLQALFHWMMF